MNEIYWVSILELQAKAKFCTISEWFKFKSVDKSVEIAQSFPPTQWCLDVDEREKRTWGLSSTQWYFNIFWVGKQKKKNVLTRAFRGRQGQRRPSSEGGWFWGWKCLFKKKKKISFAFMCYGSFPTSNGSKSPLKNLIKSTRQQ